MTVDSVLTNDPQMAASVKRASKLLESILTADPELVTCRWLHAPDPAEILLELSWEDGTDKVCVEGHLRRDELLQAPDRWVQSSLQDIWRKLMFHRNKLLLKRVRETLLEVEETERAQN